MQFSKVIDVQKIWFTQPSHFPLPSTKAPRYALQHFSYFSFLKCSNGIILVATWAPAPYYPLNIHRFINILCKSQYFPIERDIAIQFYVYIPAFLLVFIVFCILINTIESVSIFWLGERFEIYDSTVLLIHVFLFLMGKIKYHWRMGTK